jgi:hypothetical protein
MTDHHVDLKLEDQEEQVTVSAVVRTSAGHVALCLFSPAGGECEVFLQPADARRIADALQAAASADAG